MKIFVYVSFLMVCSCSMKEFPIYDCSFTAIPLKRLTKPNSMIQNDDINDIINDPVHNVAGVFSCSLR